MVQSELPGSGRPGREAGTDNPTVLTDGGLPVSSSSGSILNQPRLVVFATQRLHRGSSYFHFLGHGVHRPADFEPGDGQIPLV